MFLRALNSLTFRLPFLINGKDISLLEQDLKNYLNTKTSEIISFYNWRSAIYHWLKLLWIEKWDEILVSAYTCVSVSNAVIQTWSIPVYVDIDSTYNVDPEQLENKITQKTKAIIIQHTFWKPANLDRILKTAKKHNLFVMEDCAHSLGAEYNGKKIWTFWDLSIFSFWRDKVISSVNWGFLLINNETLFNKIPKIKNSLINISIGQVTKNLIYIKVWFIAYKLYNFCWIWKIIMVLARKLKLFPNILTLKEKSCNFKKFFYKYPNCLAYIWRWELAKLDEYNTHRIKIAEFYKKELAWFVELPKEDKNEKNIYFMFMIKVSRARELMNFCKKKWVLLGDYWFWQNIAPIGTDLKKASYKWDCINTEDLVIKLVHLPTHAWIDIKSAEKVVNLIKKFETGLLN